MNLANFGKLEIKLNNPSLFNEEFFITEKIHGSNFSIYYDVKTDEVFAASRKRILDYDDNFYNYEKILDRYEGAVKRLGKEISRSVCIFGELFGGSYNHSDVARCNVRKVQTGVYYSPDIEFLAFDLAFFYEENDGWRITTREALERHCLSVGIPVVPKLKVGNLAECLNYPNDFESGIYSLYNLPKIENNICEGIVLSPVKPLFFATGTRLIIKSKNDKFSESVHYKSKKRVSVVEDTPENVQEVIDLASSYVNVNRLNNVVSKGEINPITDKSFGPLLKLFNNDVYEELLADEDVKKKIEDEFKASEKKILRKAINFQCKVVLKENFLELLDV